MAWALLYSGREEKGDADLLDDRRPGAAGAPEHGRGFRELQREAVSVARSAALPQREPAPSADS